MPTILRAYRQSPSGNLELKLELDLVSNKIQEKPDNPPLTGFDRIVLFDVNQTGKPLLILDVLPQNEDGSEQVRVSNSRKEFRINCLVRCLLRKFQAKPVLQFDCELKVNNSGQIVFDSLKMAGPPRLPGSPEVIGELDAVKTLPIELLRNRELTIERVGGAPNLAERLGLKPEAPPEPPNDDPQDPRSKLLVTFACLNDSGLSSTTEAIHLVFSRRMSIRRTEHRLLSPAPDVRITRCSPKKDLQPVNEWQEDARLSICKDQVEAMTLHDGNLAKLTIIQRQPLNRKPQEYETLPLGQWVVKLEGIPHTSALQLWNNAIARPYLHALHMIQDGRPVSFMPIWVFNRNPKPSGDKQKDDKLNDDLTQNPPFDPPTDPPVESPRWSLMAKMSDGSRDVDFDDDTFDSHSDKFRAGAVGLRVRSLFPNEIDFAVKAELPGFLSQVGEPLHVTYRVTSTQFKNGKPDEFKIEQEALPFSFKTEHLPGKTNQQISRVGALDLVFPERPSVQSKKSDDQLAADSLLRVCFRKAALGDPYSEEVLTVNIKGRLALLDLMPGGQDDLPGEEFVASDSQGACAAATEEEKFEAELEQRFRRNRPLLIPFPANLANALTNGSTDLLPDNQERMPKFILDFEERTEAERSQTLSMRLIEYAGSNLLLGKQRLIALDTQPFLIALVEAPPFAGSEREGIREIGNWSATAEEGASWELIGSGDGFSLFLPPQGVGEAMEKWKLAGEFEDVPVDKPIDFRFAPLAKMNLKPSFFKQRFAEAPWNLRRILGFPGQRAPGAGVVDARFELFYGLSCQVTYPFLRLAELDSKLGQIPGRLSREIKWAANATPKQLEFYKNFRKAWAELYRRYLSRLSVLEAYDANQPANLVVTDRLTYELRNTARLRYPISDKLVPVGDKRRNAKPHSKDGLAGGVSWGFESANIYDQLLSEPKSFDGSQLSNLFLSSLGGWGNQKAVFNGGLTTIYANVAMGRTYFYSIERIGRIGVFWNLAKHVIIYERTVAPTEQFKGKQEHHLKRPLLRKVREFVELLEPVRKYPEFGAEAVTRGFVTGIEFKSRIINVDSEWGNDIPNEGWQVPLWNIQASQDNPNVYPKPQIVMEVAADAGSVINVELEEPEKLLFFTRTVDDSQGKNGVKVKDRANTNKWPAVRNVDFPDQPSPARPNIPASDPASLDRALPDASVIEPGYEQFTFAIAPASRQINLVAERAAEAVNVALRNVTMARARARKLADFAADKQAQAGQALDGLKMLSRVTEQTETILQSILARVPKDGTVSPEAIAGLKTAIDDLIKVSKEANGLADTFKKLAGHTVDGKTLSSFFRSKDALSALLNSFTDTAIDEGRDRVFEMLNAVLMDLQKVVIELGADSPDNLKSRVQTAAKEHGRRVEEIFAVINTGLEEFDRQVETGYQAALDFKAQAEREINAVITLASKLTAETSAQAHQEIEELRRKLQALLRKLESASRSGTKGKLAGLIETVRANIAAIGKLIDDKFKLIDGIVGQGGAKIAQELANFKNDLAAEFGKFDQGLTSIRTGIQGALEEAQTALKAPRDAVATLTANLDKAISEAADETVGSLKDAVFKGIADTSNVFVAAINLAKTQIQAVTNNKIKPNLLDEVAEFGTSLAGLLTGENGGTHFLEGLKAKLDATNGKAFAELRGEIERAFDDVRFRLAPFAERVNDTVTELAGLGKETLHQAGDTTLRLLRAFGDAPRVPMLDFNRLRLAYYFDELNKHVDLTPVTALFNRAGDELKGFGLRFPVSNLLDRVVPDVLENFNLSDIFPDFAGLKLEKLFSGLKFPVLPKLPNLGNGENVKVMHGIDKQARRAWVKAAIDVELTEDSTVFSFGPIELKLANARFTALATITAEPDSAPVLKVEGQIKGDWQLIILGTSLVTFRETTLAFDDRGKIRFNIETDKIELAGALQFLSDLLKRFLPGGGDDLPPTRLVIVDGKPAGVETVIDLPLPPVQLGAFGVSGLVMGAGFRLLLRPTDAGIDFALGVALSFGKKEDPFTLTIFILGGGGWFDTRLTYYPLTNRLLGDITIGITASATLAISLGPIRGAVSITFGVYADFHIDSGSGTSFAITLMLLLKGEVEVKGLISVAISLLLEAQYSSDGSLVGRGTLKIRVKICWCFTFKFSKEVTYTFKKGSGAQAAIASFDVTALAAGDVFDQAAHEYLEMFE